METLHNENCLLLSVNPLPLMYSAQFWLEDLACFQNSFQIILCYVPVKPVSMFVWFFFIIFKTDFYILKVVNAFDGVSLFYI